MKFKLSEFTTAEINSLPASVRELYDEFREVTDNFKSTFLLEEEDIRDEDENLSETIQKVLAKQKKTNEKTEPIPVPVKPPKTEPKREKKQAPPKVEKPKREKKQTPPKVEKPKREKKAKEKAYKPQERAIVASFKAAILKKQTKEVFEKIADRAKQAIDKGETSERLKYIATELRKFIKARFEGKSADFRDNFTLGSEGKKLFSAVALSGSSKTKCFPNDLQGGVLGKKETSLANSFIKLQGKPKTKTFWLSFMAKVNNAIEAGENSERLKYIRDEVNKLISFIEKPSDTAFFEFGKVGKALFTAYELAGVRKKKVRSKARQSALRHGKREKQGLSGFSATEIDDMKGIELHEYWAQLFGNPYKGFYALIHGPAGSGKSTLLLQFAEYWANSFGKVAYISYEEGRKATMSEKLKRIGINAPDLFIFENMTELILNARIRDFDLVIFDSLQAGGVTPEMLRTMRNEHPTISILAVSQETKNGHFRGSNEYAHDSDVIVKVENGTANSFTKNRLGAGGEVQITFQ